MLQFLCLFFIFFFLKPNYVVPQSCWTFKDTSILLREKNGGDFIKNVTGCIQRIEFDDNTTVVEALVQDQQVKKLWRDTVRNMKYLRTVSFVRCETDYISPIAFRNVPSLSNVQVSWCKLREIRQGTFTFDLVPKLETLSLDNNEIHYIEDQTFSNLTNLKNIYLHHNHLEIWRQEWFLNASSLQIIDFRHNRIRSIPTRAFVDLRNIRQICFDYNDITEISRDAFKEIRYLEYLGLSHNKLTTLDSDSFPNTLRITNFTIHANYLSYLTNDLLKKLTAVKITMDYNPWKCKCLERINYWLYIKNGQASISDVCKRSHVPVCAVPQNNANICTEYYDEELTQKYIGLLRNLSTPLDPSCAKLELLEQ